MPSSERAGLDFWLLEQRSTPLDLRPHETLERSLWSSTVRVGDNEMPLSALRALCTDLDITFGDLNRPGLVIKARVHLPSVPGAAEAVKLGLFLMWVKLETYAFSGFVTEVDRKNRMIRLKGERFHACQLTFRDWHHAVRYQKEQGDWHPIRPKSYVPAPLGCALPDVTLTYDFSHPTPQPVGSIW